MKEIRLVNSDLSALVDDEDYELASQFKWYRFKPKRSTAVYAKTNPSQSNMYLHRLIMGFPPCQVDHRNRNGLDCQKGNLRVATRVQQTANSSCAKRGGACQSRFKGVHRHHTGKWVARVHKDSAPIHLGMFATEEDAARAYNKAASEMFGEFARLNDV